MTLPSPSTRLVIAGLICIATAALQTGVEFLNDFRPAVRSQLRWLLSHFLTYLVVLVYSLARLPAINRPKVHQFGYNVAT